MRRISHEELRIRIYVKLRTFRKRTLRALVSKLPHEGDKATGEVADAIADLVAGGDARLIIPTPVKSKLDNQEGPGRWGPDDPDPTEYLDRE
ncbi:hypothetical protein [Parasphingopyxis marina]|uniref:Uncharacterized protein n=1 Tax=Parasphingopyxis marina TaxID=2761622 RepID=A0A842HUH9_9SPHN|nr:hypothetical protein [Parasphingopyxis marina]MBC2776726.1 hypothetical protein [Parasphingopyxis marina]